MNEINTLLGVCRGCMADITSQEHCSQQTLDMFTYCTSLQVSDEEDLPKNFCTKCCETVDLCFHFIEQARKSDVTMRNLLSRAQTSVIIHRQSIASDRPKVYVKYEHNEFERNVCTDYYDDFPQYTVKNDHNLSMEEFDHTLNESELVNSKNGKSEGSVEMNAIQPVEEIKPSKTQLTSKMQLRKAYNVKRQHSSGDANECPTCMKMFVSKKWFSKHMASVHSHTFSCNFCSKQFRKRYLLKQHMVTHSEERPFACHVCPKRFKMRKQLNLHLRMHRQPSLYQCEHCRMSFKLKGTLVTHMTVHYEDKGNLCDLCGAKFSQAGNLAVHMRTHTGEKPYRCTRCSFRCAVRSSLRRHERRHDGTRPHACVLCGKRFADRASLSRHVRTHTGELPYSCGYCEQAFIDSWKRKSHIMKQHNVAFADLPRDTSRTRRNRINSLVPGPVPA